ncbi:DUF885 domain-containing protein [Actinomyces vulturis]|uniref:DUF885 domain-containing protein n=1 Tax=Actinomyces vulturis TaxID=1857645 RepID=UPI000832C820|nr:DUF885 domain-containing protein [Actinomyces vulturis]
MSEIATSTPRPSSPLDQIAEDYVKRVAELSPQFATVQGLSGHHDELDDYSPAGLDALAALNTQTLTAARKAPLTDAIDEVTLAAMEERMGLSSQLHERGEDLRALNNIASPVQDIRDFFDLVPTSTDEDWANIASRLSKVPAAMAGYRESLSLAASRGMVSARRQVEACINQALSQADQAESSFSALVNSAENVSPALRSELEAAAAQARGAYADLAAFLKEDLLPQAPTEDACGRERYELFSQDAIGARIDLDETYEWGRERLAAIDAEQRQIAEELYGPGVSVREALERLNNDPAHQIHGVAALQEWMQSTSDQAIADLDGVHFDVPKPLKTLNCKIAPSSTGGIYYTGPSDDFSRPGAMWWSVPAGTTTFAAWQERTTVFHEGVPGHHLQVGLQTYHRDLLNSWRRMCCWVSGHGEGWALYAERLMADLGYQDNPADRMGMLDSQRLRAARVVLDIGVHLGKERPSELASLPGVGEGRWDRDSAWAFLTHNVAMAESFLAYELTRYLGWPGQAPSYAVGQRLWEQIRDERAAAAKARGEEFSLKDFHMEALSLGSVGLDVMRQALVH